MLAGYCGLYYVTAQKLKFSIKDFLSKCDQIRSFLRIWSHLLKKFLLENFIFCAACKTVTLHEMKQYLEQDFRIATDEISGYKQGFI